MTSAISSYHHAEPIALVRVITSATTVASAIPNQRGGPDSTSGSGATTAVRRPVCEHARKMTTTTALRPTETAPVAHLLVRSNNPRTAKVAGFARSLWPVARTAPLAVGVTTAMLIVGVLTGTLYTRTAMDSDLVRSLSYGVPALHTHPFSFLAGALVVPAPELFLVMVVLVGLAVGYFERRVGTARAAAALLVTHLVGTVGAALLVALNADLPWPWAVGVAHQADLGPASGAIGVLGAATALMAPDTRRFVRWAIGMYLVVMIVQSGLLWDVEHLFGWFTGLALGPALAGRRREAFDRSVPSVRRLRTSVALLMVTIAAAKLVTVWYPAYDGIFGPGAGSVALHRPTGPLGALIGLTVTLLVANALRRGLPVAWWASLVLCGIAVAHAVVIDRMADLVCWGFVLVLLVAFRSAWPWRIPAGILRRSLPRLGVALGAFVGLSSLLFWLFGEQTAGGSAGFRARALLDRATFVDGSTAAHTRGAAAAFTVTSWIWGLALLFLLVPVVYAHHDSRRWVGRGVGRSDADPGAVQSMLHRHGGGSIGWQRTWPGFVTWTSTDGQVAISYRPVSGVAIALGDPVGPRDAWRAAAHEFRGFCFRAGWTPAWYAVTDEFRAEIGSGWQTTQIGEDAIVDLAGLEFKGKAWQDVRTARNHAAKLGVRLQEVRLTEAPAALRTQIDEVSRGWVDGKSLPEMGFTLGTIEHAADPEMRTHIAIDDAGVVHGVTTWLPVHRDGNVVGWTLDVMRRRTDGFRPVMEFLIAESALAFQAEGFATMSLSVAPLARRSPAAARTPLDRLLDRMSALLEPAYGFRSLLAFKAKFHPRFAPVYLGYASDLDLTEISLAIGKAYLPHLTARQAVTVARQLMRRSA